MPFQSRISRSWLTNARVWYLISARDQVNGRLADYIVGLLTGKAKPTYHPMSDLGDHVVVTNCKYISMLGERTWETKIYRHHTGYPGGLREIRARDIWKEDPCQILWRSVRGKMPKTRTRNRNMKRLHLFEEDDHPFASRIYGKLIAPHPMPKRLDEYTPEDIKNYPKLF